MFRKPSQGNHLASVQVLVAAVCLSAAYYGSAKVSLSMSFKPDYIAALWLPNAVLLSALLMTSVRNWPWFLIAMIPAELAADLPAGISLNMSIGFIGADWIEVVAAAMLIRRFAGLPLDWRSLRQAAMYVLCGVLIAPWVAAFPGALVTGIDQAEPGYWVRWLRWFAGDALTHLLITPVIVLWGSTDIKRAVSRPAAYYLEWSALTGTLLVTAFVVFSGKKYTIESFPALLYLPIPVLFWAAIRFGPRGIFSSSAFIAGVCIWLGSNGLGPFTRYSAAENVINLQLYLITTLTPLLFLTALIEERAHTEKELRRSEEKFRTLADTSPTAISIIHEDRYLYVNPAWEKQTGYTREEAYSLSPFMVVHPDMREQVRRNAENRLQGMDLPKRYEMKGQTKSGKEIWYDFTVAVIRYDGRKCLLCLTPDMTDRKREEREREALIQKLRKAMDEIKILRGILPICSNCKKIRDDDGYWNQIEAYFEKHADVFFSHGLCAECEEELYGDQEWYIKRKRKKDVDSRR